jgi:hypothetical protein
MEYKMKSLGELESFLIGHHLSYIGCYFEQVLLAERLAIQNDEVCQQHSVQMIEKLKAIGPNFSHRIRFVQQQIVQLDISAQNSPSIPPEYQKWISSLHPQIISNYSDESVEGWLFALGNALGELRCSMIVLLLSLDFQTQLKLDCSKTIQLMPKKIRESCEKTQHSVAFLQKLQSTKHICKKIQNQISLIWNVQRGLEKEDQSIANILIQIKAILPELSKVENPQYNLLPSRL